VSIFQLFMDAQQGITKFQPGDRVKCKTTGILGTVLTFSAFMDAGAGEFERDYDGKAPDELVVYWDKYKTSTPRKFDGTGPYCWDAALEAADYFADEGDETEDPVESTYESTLDVGDVVRLKSGGPKMTVNAIITEKNDDPDDAKDLLLAECVWFPVTSGNTLEHMPQMFTYATDALELA